MVPIPDPDNHTARCTGMEFASSPAPGRDYPHSRLARNNKIFLADYGVDNERTTRSPLAIEAMTCLCDERLPVNLIAHTST